MNYDDNTLLIGLRPGIDMQTILGHLHQVKGFKGILKKFRLINATLIEIDPDQYELAFSHLRALESIIEYVERNFIIYPATFDKIADFNLISEHCHSEKIHNLHKLAPESLAGRCVRIALIDTGLSPHPYLPAVSYHEMIERNELYFDKNLTYYNKHYFGDFAKIEKDPNAGLYSDNFPTAQINNYQNDTKRRTTAYWDAAMENHWVTDADNWYITSLQKSKIQKIPNLPIYPKFFGYLRRISPLSYNFVDNNLNVTDIDNHGTLMAGIISGYSWINHHIDDKSIKDRAMIYEFDINGLSPFSELLVIKSFEKKKRKKNLIATLLEAIEYAHDNEADLIYIGLQAPQSDPSIPGGRYIALNNMIMKCHSKEIPVICPAGNAEDGKVGKAGLKFPAACSQSWAITSVYFEGQQDIVKFSPHSLWADRNLQEAVSFAAFGGDKKCKMLTTSNNFGVELVTGTSVAGAIATGIFARFLSRKYAEQINDKYNKFMKDSFRLDKTKPSNLLPVDLEPKKITISEIHSQAESKADKTLKTIQSGLPDEKVGYGILRTL